MIKTKGIHIIREVMKPMIVIMKMKKIMQVFNAIINE
jgi:hypothetical protein